MRRPDRRAFAGLALLCAGTAAALPGHAAASPQSQLESVQNAMTSESQREAALAKQAQDLAGELAGLRQQEITAAQAAQQHELALDALETRLVKLTGEEKARTAELAQRRQQQSQLLLALERLAASPPEGLLLEPGSPVDALRGALLMGAAVPPLEARAQTLKQQLADLASLQAQVTLTQAQHWQEGAALAGEQARLADLIARKSQLQESAALGAAATARHLQRLAAQAGNLRDLVSRIDAEQRQEDAAAQQQASQSQELLGAPPPVPAPAGSAQAIALPPPSGAAGTPAPTQTAMAMPPALGAPAPQPAAPGDTAKPGRIRPFSQARGAMIFPAAGPVLFSFGDRNDKGSANKGLTIETRAGAQVVAPFDGQVVFAGPFRGYGQILIISHGDGYHSLVAGLDRVECSVGQWLVAGEPVGVMPDSTDKPHLYLELRHDNQPINPLPWLVTRVEKVNG